MNLSLIIGWVISFGLVVFGIIFDMDSMSVDMGKMFNFMDLQSCLITGGGTVGCLIASLPR